MSRYAGLFVMLIASHAWAQQDAVAVLDIQGTGIEPELLPTFTEILSVEIANLDKYKVITGRDIQAMLGFEKEKDMVGCTEAACLAEIGGALGVDRIVASHIGKVGSTYVLNIKLINIRSAQTEGRVYEPVRGEVDAVINTIRRSVYKLFGMEPPASAVADAGDDGAAGSGAGGATKSKSAAHVTKVSGGGGIGVAPYVLWGVGAASVGAGIVLGKQAKEAEECAKDPFCVGGQLRARDARRKSLYANLAIGMGAVSIAGGVVWALVSALSGSDEEMALTPVLLAPQSIGLAYTRGF